MNLSEHAGADTPAEDPLFELPPQARKPLAKVILLTDPSGSGKTAISSRLGIPAVSLDHFYKDEDAPGMPHIKGNLIDWDDPASWDSLAAFRAIEELCLTGETTVPIYDIPTNRSTGTRPFTLGEHKVFIAEGIFASELVAPLQKEGLLIEAVCIARSPLKNAWFRLLRDMGEARKSLPILITRGARLALEEPKKVGRWIDSGCKPAKSLGEATRRIQAFIGRGHNTGEDILPEG